MSGCLYVRFTLCLDRRFYALGMLLCKLAKLYGYATVAPGEIVDLLEMENSVAFQGET